MEIILSFTGRYEFLSNFYQHSVRFEGESYPTVEHVYQAAKAERMGIREQIRRAPTPQTARKMGRSLVLRPDWEQAKEDIMFGLLQQKFSDPRLRERLLATGDALLVEGNTWGDRTWGCVFSEGVWVGENKLGEMLMFIRRRIKEGMGVQLIVRERG